MSALTDADIERIGRGLLDRSLPKREWTHAAHFAAALWLLRAEGAAAHARMPPAIRAYNEATGVANTDSGGYHDTTSRRRCPRCSPRSSPAPRGAPTGCSPTGLSRCCSRSPRAGGGSRPTARRCRSSGRRAAPKRPAATGQRLSRP